MSKKRNSTPAKSNLASPNNKTPKSTKKQIDPTEPKIITPILPTVEALHQQVDITNDLITNTTPIKCILSCNSSHEGKINCENIEQLVGLESSSQYVLSVKQSNGHYSFIKFDKLKDLDNLINYSSTDNSSKIYFNNESLVYYTKQKSSILEHSIENKQSKDASNYIKDIKKHSIVKNIFENEFIHINNEHVLHTIKGASISISLKKVLNNVDHYQYKYGNENILIYLHISTNTLYSYNFVTDKSSKLVTFKKQFNNINISKHDDNYLMVTMSNNNSFFVQIWNHDLNTLMKYSMIKNSKMNFVAYQTPYVLFDKCLFKIFKFESVKFTKAVQIKNRKLTNIFVDSQKSDNGFVYSIHDSSQWNKVETDLQKRRVAILENISKHSNNLFEHIKQLPLIEYYQILLEYIYDNISNEKVLPCLVYLLSNYNQIEKADSMTSIHIGIMNNIVHYLLENYKESHRESLDLILKLVLLSNEQITNYINIYGKDKYETGLRLILNTQYGNVQLLNMMRHVKTLDFDIILMVLNLLKENSVHMEACMVWAQVLIHSHFGEFLLKKDCLEIAQEIQMRIKKHISELKQLALVKSELGVIASGMSIPKKKEQKKDKLMLNGARWNAGESDYNVSLNYF